MTRRRILPQRQAFAPGFVVLDSALVPEHGFSAGEQAQDRGAGAVDEHRVNDFGGLFHDIVGLRDESLFRAFERSI